MEDRGDDTTLQPFVDQLEKWGCHVLRAVNRPNPYRGGFSILFRSPETTARAIADLGIIQVLVDIRADTYLLRLPDVDMEQLTGPQPPLVLWTEESKQQKLEELLALWKTSGDILERRRQRLGLFYKNQ